MMTNKLFFKEIESRNELESLLRFRYRTYRQGPFAGLCPENAAGIDLDGYDENALHFGLYMDGVPVAYDRLILGYPTRYAPWVREIVFGDRFLEDRIAARSGVDYPVLEVAQNGDGAWKVLEERRDRGRFIVEASRLCVDPGFRGGSVMTRMIAALAGYCLSQDWDVILTSKPESRRFYERFGFRTLGGMEDRYVPQWAADRCFLIGSGEWMDPGTRNKLISLLETLSRDACGIAA